MSVREIDLSPALGARLTRLIGIAVAALLLLWAAGYLAGVWPWLGRESWSRVQDTPIGEDRAGGTTGFGPGAFVFIKGQTIVFSYDVTIRRGCLWLHVWHLFEQGPQAHTARCIDTSGAGEWTVPVAATGIYRIFIDSFPTRGPSPAWDLRYTVWWGARWQTALP